jgi:hypothetical protein
VRPAGLNFVGQAAVVAVAAAQKAVAAAQKAVAAAQKAVAAAQKAVARRPDWAAGYPPHEQTCVAASAGLKQLPQE